MGRAKDRLKALEGHRRTQNPQKESFTFYLENGIYTGIQGVVVSSEEIEELRRKGHELLIIEIVRACVPPSEDRLTALERKVLNDRT